MVCSALCEAESNLFTQMPPDLGHSLEELHPGPWNFLSPLGPAHVLLPGAGTGEGLALLPAPGRCRRAAGSFLVLARARSPRPHARPWHCSSVGERGAPRTRSRQADRRFDFPSSCLKSAAIAVFLSAQLVGTERFSASCSRHHRLGPQVSHRPRREPLHLGSRVSSGQAEPALPGSWKQTAPSGATCCRRARAVFRNVLCACVLAAEGDAVGGGGPPQVPSL